MMDTPKKTQISTPLSKFEDSPVFNYINSLSPIKPVKAIHITQTFNPLSFAALPSVFTSPHVSTHKESRFLKRHNSPDPTREENKVSETDNVNHSGRLCNNPAELPEDLDPRASTGEASLEMPIEPSTFVTEPTSDSIYDSGGPRSDPATCVVEETYYVSESVSASLSVVPMVKQASKKDLPAAASEVQLEFKCPIEQKEASREYDWENLISDATDLLIFSPPNDSKAFRGIIQKSLEKGVRVCTSRVSRLPRSCIDELSSRITFDSEEQDEDPLLQPGDNVELKEVNKVQGNFETTDIDYCITNNSTDTTDNELYSNLHRGMRRRCLDFETQGAQTKSSDVSSNSNSSEDKQLVPLKPSNGSSCRILPGIGLHLNALAITSSDTKYIKHKALSYGRQKITFPGSSTFMIPVTKGQEAPHKSLDSQSTMKEIDPLESRVQLIEGDDEASLCIVNEELNQNSPKKKRRKSEAGEAEACKRCNCKKSKCLKLYCECFAAGVYCIEPCSCQDCFNKPIHEDTVLATRKQIESRNPLAFAPKVIRTSDSIPEGDDFSKTPASARHKRGCNCKKSNCLKKYCECFQGGVGCSINCRCEGCKNAFGRKDVETEEELEEEAETCKAEKALQQAEIQNIEEQNPALALPSTPMQFCRPLVQLPFSSKSKLPQSLLAVRSSSGLHDGQTCGKPNILQPQTKFEKHFQSVEEDEIPEILQGNSPSTAMKTSSPNGKRISPPNVESGVIPGNKGGRRLILQSIPSFPSLTPQH